MGFLILKYFMSDRFLFGVLRGMNKAYFDCVLSNKDNIWGIGSDFFTPVCNVTPAYRAVWAALDLAYAHDHGWAISMAKILSWAEVNPSKITSREHAKSMGITPQVVVDCIQPQNLGELEVFAQFCWDNFCEGPVDPLKSSFRLVDGVIRHTTATGRLSWQVSEEKIEVVVNRCGKQSPCLRFYVYFKTKSGYPCYGIQGGGYLPRHVSALERAVAGLLEAPVMDEKSSFELKECLVSLADQSKYNLEKFDQDLAEYMGLEPIMPGVSSDTELFVVEQLVDERYKLLANKIQGLGVGVVVALVRSFYFCVKQKRYAHEYIHIS